MKQILCFGDSNTWGFIPETKERYPKGIRWTSLLQEKFGDHEIQILEEGLCGRTTVYEDRTRPGRKGIVSLSRILEQSSSIDAVVLMLGTNDCKSCYRNSAKTVADGIEACLELLTKFVPAQKILLVSPIWLGEEVWKEKYDPEFDRESVTVSKQLREEYAKVAGRRKVHFMAASDYVSASRADQEHLSVIGHRILAEAIFEKLRFIEDGQKRRSA